MTDADHRMAHAVDPSLLPTREECPEGVWVELCTGTARSTQVLRGWREGVRWARGFPIEAWDAPVIHLHQVLTTDRTYPISEERPA